MIADFAAAAFPWVAFGIGLALFFALSHARREKNND